MHDSLIQEIIHDHLLQTLFYIFTFKKPWPILQGFLTIKVSFISLNLRKIFAVFYGGQKSTRLVASKKSSNKTMGE